MGYHALPTQEPEPTSRVSCLAGGFFTTKALLEAGGMINQSEVSVHANMQTWTEE